MQQIMRDTVSVLITWDIDPTPEVTIGNKKLALEAAVALLSGLGIHSTFFTHARIADRIRANLEALLKGGHEIGCHGLTHGDEEEYSRMPEPMQRAYLTEATGILERVAGRPVTSFRSPRVKTSHTTQKVLAELGYRADCSVASQRVDFVSSNLVSVSWILAPRMPYHPSRRSAFRRGSRRSLWVVPLSAIGIPFISSALYVCGLRFMRLLFDILYREALATGKPIVYLVHPFEMAPFTERVPPTRLSPLQRLRTHGLWIRQRFYERDHAARFALNRQLLEYISRQPRVRYLTVHDYVEVVLAPGERTRRQG